ncbi:hypothetical protein AVEN_149377-1 [Araneus ventricosus]|uniref:Uncharacterized protein n=1 Tax=Araneus ventricosus TaxID=182803 RepID=A0A4Y2SH65_ARAVE|nr:hypothetical protein AVEN_192486-1 [Araneus ventricosus]GBN87572.1 hypothetical protein AVEN_149377-1 [Araneus ventricosus]
MRGATKKCSFGGNVSGLGLVGSKFLLTIFISTTIKTKVLEKQDGFQLNRLIRCLPGIQSHGVLVIKSRLQGSEGSKFETRFHQSTMVYVSLVHVKSDVDGQTSSLCCCAENWRRRAPAQILSSSSDYGSKRRGLS